MCWYSWARFYNHTSQTDYGEKWEKKIPNKWILMSNSFLDSDSKVWNIFIQFTFKSLDFFYYYFNSSRIYFIISSPKCDCCFFSVFLSTSWWSFIFNRVKEKKSSSLYFFFCKTCTLYDAWYVIIFKIKQRTYSPFNLRSCNGVIFFYFYLKLFRVQLQERFVYSIEQVWTDSTILFLFFCCSFVVVCRFNFLYCWDFISTKTDLSQ